MIVDLPSSTVSAVNKKLVDLRESGGVLALGRVLTLVIVTDDGGGIERAIEAGNSASREHPCRVIVLARGQRRAAARLDAQIRVGGDAGASEVVVLRGYGALAADEAGAGMVMPLLLPDAPVVAWWPGEAPAVPSTDAIGRLAARRITDALSAKNPVQGASSSAGRTTPRATPTSRGRGSPSGGRCSPRRWTSRRTTPSPRRRSPGRRSRRRRTSWPAGWPPGSASRCAGPGRTAPGWSRCAWSAAPGRSS